MQLILAIFNIFIISFIFWGYGRILLIICRPKLRLNLGLAFAFGIALFTLGSGYLELFQLASPIIFKLFVYLGLLLAILNFSKSSPQIRSQLGQATNLTPLGFMQNKPTLLTFSSVLSTLLFIFTSLSYFYFLPLNVHDDFNGYLILAERILQEGFQGGDPFNDHSIEQGFGAGNYILALVAIFLPLMSLHLADAGIGLLLLVAFIVSAVRKSSHRSVNAIGPCIFILCITAINAPIVNTTPLLLACGLFLAAIIFYIQSDFGASLKDHILLAILLSSFLVLKGNYIIPVTGIGFCIYLSRMQIAGFFQTIKEFGIFSGCMVIFTLPWLISNWQFSGTPFYPLLGHGLVSPNALSIVSPSQFIEANLTLLPSYCLLISLLAILMKSYPKAKRPLLFFISCLTLSVILLSFALTTTSAGLFTRYSYVTLFGPTSFLFIYVVFNTSRKIYIKDIRTNPIKLFTLLILIIFCIPHFFYGFKYATREITKTISNKKNHAFQYININNETTRVRALQAVIPEQSKIILRLDMPFLADFSRHRVFVMDWPGNVGPAPGVPFSEPPETLAVYLRKQGIQYIIYSYKNEALFSAKNPELVDRIDHPNPWIRTQALRTFAVQKQIEALSKKYRIVYDNGQDFVLDLNSTIQ